MSRGDFLWTERGLQCLELNMASLLGGWECAAWAEDHLEVPFFRRFLDEADLTLRVRGTLEAMLTRVFEDSAPLATPGGEIVAVALIDPEAVLVAADHPFCSELARLWSEIPAARGWRGPAHFEALPADRLEAREGRLFWQGRRIHAVIELLHGLTPPQVLRPWLAQGLRLYNGPLTQLLGDKRCLALLSEQASIPDDDSVLEAGEQELVRRLVPWTRRVVPGPVDFEGETLSCADLLRLGKDRLVLKHSRSLSGNDVYVGTDTPEALWREACAGALRSGSWVMQELLASLPFPFQDEERGIVPATVIWGLFGFGGSYGGCFTRAVPQGGKRVVNASKGARDGVCFEAHRASAAS